MHSIVIPHRGRELHLELCLWALDRSATACGIDDWETVVVDDPVPADPDGFNKARALNLGIERARGDILTFLDVDAIVGARFLEAALCLEDASLDRCCYRVRKLPMCEDLRIQTAEDRAAYVSDLFEEYSRYPMAMESYGAYCIDVRRPPGPRGKRRVAWDQAMASGRPWGNSQFSIRREKLGDSRYDEEIGWHAEDIDMNMQLQARFGLDYRGRIFTAPDHAMFHLEHTEHPWDEPRRNLGSRRLAIHKKKRKQLLGW